MCLCSLQRFFASENLEFPRHPVREYSQKLSSCELIERGADLRSGKSNGFRPRGPWFKPQPGAFGHIVRKLSTLHTVKKNNYLVILERYFEASPYNLELWLFTI